VVNLFIYSYLLPTIQEENYTMKPAGKRSEIFRDLLI